MDRSVLFLLQAMCAVALLSGSDAVRCYTCSSDHDLRCADPIDKTMLPADCSVDQVKRAARQLASLLGPSSTLGVDAFGERYAQYGGGQPAMGCQKLDLLINTQQEKNKNYTIRGCVLLAEEPEEHCRRVSQSMQSELVQNTFCGSCKAEGCNSASGLTLSILAAVAPALLTLVLFSRSA